MANPHLNDPSDARRYALNPWNEDIKTIFTSYPHCPLGILRLPGGQRSKGLHSLQRWQNWRCWSTQTLRASSQWERAEIRSSRKHLRSVQTTSVKESKLFYWLNYGCHFQQAKLEEDERPKTNNEVMIAYLLGESKIVLEHFIASASFLQITWHDWHLILAHEKRAKCLRNWTFKGWKSYLMGWN